MQKGKSINAFVLTMISIAAILSIRNWTPTAEYGLSSIFYIILASGVFFIPLSLTVAELATGWPHKGGVYAWVREALGERMAFLAVWFFWTENVAWYPIILAFISSSLAYSFDPTLSQNPVYTFLVSITTYWIITFLNLCGMKVSGFLSSLFVLLGTLLPGVLIILFGCAWFFQGLPLYITFSWDTLVPTFTTTSQLVFLSLMILSFCGIEMSGVHAEDVEEPKSAYPKAIFATATIMIIATILGTLSISIVIPPSKLSLLSGIMDSISIFLNQFGMSSAIPLFALALAIGSLGGVTTWTAGPSRGLAAAALRGDLPLFFQKINRHNMPVTIMIFQAAIVTVLSSLYLFLPSLNTAFVVLSVLTLDLTLFMYLLLFTSLIVLRIKKPHFPRPFTIPGKMTGAWIVALLGFFSSIFAFAISLIPPPDIKPGMEIRYWTYLGIGLILFILIPFFILAFKNDGWKPIQKS